MANTTPPVTPPASASSIHVADILNWFGANWWFVVLLTLCIFYLCAAVDTSLTVYMFGQHNAVGFDKPLSWFHCLLAGADVSQVPVDITAGLSGLFTGAILPHTSRESLQTRPAITLTIWMFCVLILLISLFNIVEVRIVNDDGIVCHPVPALIALNRSALYFVATLVGSLTGYRLIGK